MKAANIPNHQNQQTLKHVSYIIYIYQVISILFLKLETKIVIIKHHFHSKILPKNIHEIIQIQEKATYYILLVSLT